MSKHFVLAITGPAGAGKSTIGEKVAKQFKRCVNIDADHVKHMIVSGFYVSEGSPENPEGWGFGEWGLVGDSIGLLTRNFLNHDYDVIINGYIDEPAWAAIEQHVTINHKVLLLPHIDTVVERDAARLADVQMGAVMVAEHHRHFSTDEFFKNFITLDTTSQSIDETTTKIIQIVDAAHDAD
jgi:hypothetical protein